MSTWPLTSAPITWRIIRNLSAVNVRIISAMVDTSRVLWSISGCRWSSFRPSCGSCGWRSRIKWIKCVICCVALSIWIKLECLQIHSIKKQCFISPLNSNHLPSLNHFGTVPVLTGAAAFEAMKFLGTEGFAELDDDDEPAAAFSSWSTWLLLDPSTFWAPEPEDNFCRNSSLMRIFSAFSSHPKCSSADGTQFDSINVSFGSRICFGGVVTVARNKHEEMKKHLINHSHHIHFSYQSHFST